MHFMFCCTLLCILSSFAIILTGKRDNWLIYFVCLPGVLCDCNCSVALTDGVVGWSAGCDCGISGSYSLALAFSFSILGLFPRVLRNWKKENVKYVH